MEETNYYKAKEGYTFKRKVDDFIMGNELYLGLFIDGTNDIEYVPLCGDCYLKDVKKIDYTKIKRLVR